MTQTLFPDAVCWAQQIFSSVDLGRADRNDRLLFSAASLAAQPGASFPTVFARRDLRCFYSLMHRPEATPAALLAGSFAHTKQAMTTSDDVILVIHDTTELDFTSHQALHDQLGPIGDGRGRGLLQHNSLAVRARDGLLLGLAHQQLVLRQPAPPGETRTQRKHRDRESILWQRGFEGVGPTPEGCTWVDVCDRGADLFEALHAALQLGHQALIRACQDRCILVEQADGELRPDKLMTFARSLPGQMDDVVAVTQKGGRPARVAQVQLAGAVVWIEPPKQLPNRHTYPDRRVWVLRVWEPHPPEGAEALEWVLLSTLPAQTDEQLRTRRDWYARRWPVAEDYHQAEKTGCGEEKVRFQDVASLQASLALLAAVAVRVVQLRQVARACPDEPAASVATALEIALLEQALGSADRATALKTVSQFVRGVARLGGFLGRKCDGEPGWKTLWRGYQKLQGLVEGARLHEQILRQQSGMGAVSSTGENDPQRPP
jgi:hypothetical protein